MKNKDMKKLNILYTMLLITATSILGGCAAEEALPTPEGDPIGIRLTVDEAAPATRTGDNQTSSYYTPAGGSVILFHQSVKSAINATYICNGTSWESSAPLYWGLIPSSDDADVTFHAVAPNVPSTTDIIPTDQSDMLTFTETDLLAGETTVARNTKTLDFSLDHLLSLVEVKLVNRNALGEPTAGDITSSEVVMGGLLTEYSATGTMNGYSINVRGNAPTDNLKPLVVDATTHHFIAPPQTVTTLDFDIEVEHNEFSKNYSYSYSGSTELVAGKKTVFTLTLKEGKVIDITADIEDWTDKEGSGSLNNGDIYTVTYGETVIVCSRKELIGILTDAIKSGAKVITIDGKDDDFLNQAIDALEAKYPDVTINKE